MRIVGIVSFPEESSGRICSRGSFSVFQKIGWALLTLALISCTAETRKVRLLGTADLFFNSGDYEKAKIEYLNALRLDPTDTTVLRQIGIIWLEEGTPLRAYPYFVRAKELEPQNITARTKLAAVFAAVGQNDDARREALGVLEESPGEEEALFVLIKTADSEEDFARVEEQIRKIPEQNDLFYHEASAELALQKGQLFYAKSETEQALQLQPKSVEAHLAMASLCWLQQDLDKAAQEFETAAELSPPRSEARLKYAQFELEIGQTDKARLILNDITRQTPDYLPAWCTLAQIAVSSGRYDEARSLLENVFSRDWGNVDATILQSQAWLREGETKKAKEKLESLANSYPHVPLINYNLGQAYFVDNNFTQAAAALNDALRVKPDYTDAIVLLAQTNLQIGKPELVVTPMSALHRRTPGLLAAELLLVEAYRKLGKLDEAIEILRDEVRRSPNSADAYARLGAILRERQKAGEAEDALKKALDLAPNNVLAFEQLVSLNISKKDFSTAKQLIQQRLEQTSNPAVAYLALGKTFAAQADWENATVAFQKAINADPKLPGAFDLLISSYLSSNKLPQAVSELNSFLAKNPSNIEALTDLGVVYERMQEYTNASETYNKVLSIVPDSAGVLNNLAYIYSEHLDDPDKAVELASKARALKPLDPAIADTFGWALYHNADYLQSLTVLRDAATKLRDNPEVQFHFGMASYMMGITSSAEAAFKVALTGERGREEAMRRLNFLREIQNLSLNHIEDYLNQNPDDVVGWSRLGEQFRQQGLFSQSAAAYERALSINPEFGAAAIKLAELNFGPLQHREAAYDFAKRARDLLPADPYVADLFGRVVFEIGNLRWAYSLFQEAVRRLDTDPSVIRDFAFSSYSLGKIQEARHIMQTVGRLHPAPEVASDAAAFLQMTSPDPLPRETEIDDTLNKHPNYIPALMAKAQQHSDPKTAIALYQKVLDQWPEFPLAQKSLAAVYAEEPGKTEAAFDLALKARNSLIDDPELAQTLGVISYRRKDFPYAVQCFQESARKRPLRARELFYLGMAQLRMSQDRESRKTLETAIRAGLPEPMMNEAKTELAELLKRTSAN